MTGPWTCPGTFPNARPPLRTPPPPISPRQAAAWASGVSKLPSVFNVQLSWGTTALDENQAVHLNFGLSFGGREGRRGLPEPAEVTGAAVAVAVLPAVLPPQTWHRSVEGTLEQIPAAPYPTGPRERGQGVSLPLHCVGDPESSRRSVRLPGRPVCPPARPGRSGGSFSLPALSPGCQGCSPAAPDPAVGPRGGTGATSAQVGVPPGRPWELS